MDIQSTVAKALQSSRLTEAEWAEEAGVNRKQVYEMLKGGNLCRSTIGKLLVPLGLVCCAADRAEISAALELVAAAEEFLARVEAPLRAAEPLYVYLGVCVAGLTAYDIAVARAGLAAARQYLLMLERNDDAGTR